MLASQKLFSIANFDFRLQHLLVIGILILSVSISMLIRAAPMSFGFELFEFDPFFNFRATEYIVENGYNAYFEWIDEKSWHPFGRDISENSQVVLHIATSIFYQLFGFNSSLYAFTIIFPMVVGSLTAISVFAFVRVLGGTTAGLFAALMFSVSVPIFSRGLVGWFKSEPLGLFFAFLAMYLFVSGIMNYRGKSSLLKLLVGGFFLALGLSSWGGILFFIIPIMIFYFIVPFLKSNNNSSLIGIPLFSVSVIAFSLLFERTTAFTIGYAGILIGFSTMFVIVCELIKKFTSESKHFRNCIIFLSSIIVSIVAIFSSGIVTLPGFRYLNAVNPFMTSLDPLTDSVAEHMTTTIDVSYSFVSAFIIFGVIGIWFLFSRQNVNLKTKNRIFALIVSICAIYISSSFVRLEIFASVGLIILGSIGLAILSKKVFESSIFSPTKIAFCGVIVILFLIPVTLPENTNWIKWGEFPPTISHGATFYKISTNDWTDAMKWLKYNTPENSVIASWWDYGYWITTLSDRTTLADNATLIDWQIKKLAYSLMTTPENSWHILNSHYTEDISQYLGNENIEEWGGETYEDWLSQDSSNIDCKPISALESKNSGIPRKACFPISSGFDADYIIVFVAGERIDVPDSDLFFYTLDGGADESKKHWFAKISNHEVSTFVEPDGLTPTPYFMENSTLGQLIPFSLHTYVERNTGNTHSQYFTDSVPIFVKNPKLVDPDNDPFYLVYASPSFYSQVPGPMITVLIYKINADYTPLS